jgi:hypothetical protein
MIEWIKAFLFQALRAAKRRLFGLNQWEHFLKADWSGDRQWSEYYKSGKHRAIWDHSYQSPELVGFAAGANLRNRARVWNSSPPKMPCLNGQNSLWIRQKTGNE